MVYAFDKISQTMIKYLYTVFNDLWFVQIFLQMKDVSEEKKSCLTCGNIWSRVFQSPSILTYDFYILVFSLL